jgi:hypothetical protein
MAMRLRHLSAAALLAAALPLSGHAAVTEENFLVRTTADLVALCTAERGDPLVTAALNFCHGFGVGVYQTLVEQEAGRQVTTHPTLVIGLLGRLAVSTKRMVPNTEARFAFAVLTTERKAA